jgi:microcystin-dependent protein
MTAPFLLDEMFDESTCLAGPFHICRAARLIKSTLKNTLPNFAEALASTPAQIDAVVAAAPAVASYLVFPGAIMDSASVVAPAGWLACDGQAIPRATFPSLFTAIGTTWGAGDGSTTFNVPNLLSRFRRHRDGSPTFAGAVGNIQSPANLAHTHGVSGGTGAEDTAHSHVVSASGTTGADSPDHTHGINNFAVGNGVPYAPSAGSNVGYGNAGAAATSGALARHAHAYAFSVSSGTESAAHAHAFSVTSAGGSADNATESRPFSATVLTCIKF